MKNYGFIPPAERLPEEYVLGGLSLLPREELQPSGQWHEFLPVKEIQRNEKFDSYNCTAYATLNCYEILFKKIFGSEKNWSERFLGINAGTRPPGNDPHKVAEALRKKGSIPDEYMPFALANTIEEYYAPDPPTPSMLLEGQKLLDEFEVKHEWVDGDAQSMMRALKFSPLGVAVYAWQQNAEELYARGGGDTHWTCVFGYEKDKFWLVYDSYDDSVKKLVWDFSFKYVKRYWLAKRTIAEKTSFFLTLWRWITSLFASKG